MKNSKVQHGEINGFLDHTTVIKGDLKFTDTMRIDGKFTGRIQSDNVLIVGEKAEIDAEIDVDGIAITGRVTGIVRARSRVEIHPGGALIGDVTTPVLRIDEGAVFQGRCDMSIEEPASEMLGPHLALVENSKRKQI